MSDTPKNTSDRASVQPPSFEGFVQWERASRDIIDFKKTYADMCGDVLAGLMLSEIVYWYLPDRAGNTKLRVLHADELWIAVRRYDWWERVRLSPREADRAMKVLVDEQIIIKTLYKFDGDPTVHIRLDRAVFLAKFAATVAEPPTNPWLPGNSISPIRENELTDPGKPISPIRENEITNPGIPVTEVTTSVTTETTGKGPAADPLPERPELFSIYEQEMGQLTPMIADVLKDALKEYPAGWPEDAVREAARYNKRFWAYAQSILQTWQREGRGGKHPQQLRAEAQQQQPGQPKTSGLYRGGGVEDDDV